MILPLQLIPTPAYEKQNNHVIKTHILSNMALVKFQFAKPKERSVESRRDALEFGKFGEQMATRYLEDKGYTILDRNYRRGHLEIDLIAQDKGELVIVEVKTRADNTHFQPEDAVDHRKRQALIRLANEYVKTHNRTENVRFDIVTIVSNAHGADIKHIKNAYNAMSF